MFGNCLDVSDSVKQQRKGKQDDSGVGAIIGMETASLSTNTHDYSFQ